MPNQNNASEKQTTLKVDYQFVPSFHFKVSFIGFEGVDIEARFQDVGGIGAELETEAVKEGGENRFTHTLPTRTKFPPLVLKRALHALPSHIVKWAEDAIYHFDFQLHQVVVSLLDENLDPLKSWTFIDAYPTKIQISDLNAKESGLVIETLELAYKRSESKNLKDFKSGENLKIDISKDHLKLK
ncbi:hypothetical protein FACS1894177_06750 [Bacteroidia bacterium]|nr:hypothetical protein FACS1894177_06750 [Bacteroidia bacterium]